MKEETFQRVKELKDKGVKRKEIAKQLGISTSAVDRAFAKIKKIAAQQPPPNPAIPEDRLREIIHEELEQKEAAGDSRLPVVLKTGKGQEVISPEGIMQQYLRGDGDHGVAMLQGMMMLRAAQLMVMSDVEIMKGQAEAQATAIKPILDIMEKAREDMDAAAQRAKESGEEIAEKAAMGTAAALLGRIDQKFEEAKKEKADIASVPNPIQGVFARVMETTLNNITQRMFGGGGQPQQQGMSLPPGWSDNRQQGGG